MCCLRLQGGRWRQCARQKSHVSLFGKSHVQLDSGHESYSTHKSLEMSLIVHGENPNCLFHEADILYDTRITSVKHILFILAVKSSWATCFDLV